MSDNSWKNKISKLDSFWDLDSLISTKRTAVKSNDSRKEIKAHEIELEGEGESTVIKKYILPKKAEAEPPDTPEKEYCSDISLIHNVKIFAWKSNYNYYENFYNDVKKYFDFKVDSAELVPFFSYVPQYSQMNGEQSRWYFFWRNRARQGEFLPSDYTYILLYVFEIINSGTLMSAEEGIKQLCLVWKNYHNTYPQLNKYLSEWICDYGLVNQVCLPKNIFGKEISLVMQGSNLKEFYASSALDDSQGFVKLILEFCSNYSYKNSRYYASNEALYDEFIQRTLKLLFDSGLLQGFSTEDCTMKRDAYTGALCSYHAKKKIEIKYCSFSRTNEFRYIIGDIIKYAENKIRAYLSIKSRLGVFSLSDGIRRRIDEYSSEYFIKKPTAKKEEKHEYDKLYDIPKKEFSLSDAVRIESDSWQTTQRLVEAFESEEEKAPAEPVEQKIGPAERKPEPAQDTDDPFSPYIEFLTFVFEKDFSNQKKFASREGKMLEIIADEINNIAADAFGDILIEEDAEGYTVIEEYTEILEKIIKGR